MPKKFVREEVKSGKCIFCGDPVDIIYKHYDDGTTVTSRRKCACWHRGQTTMHRAMFHSSTDIFF